MELDTRRASNERAGAGPSRNRLAAAAALAALIAIASGCASRDATTTGALPDDYRTRHPIVVGEQEKTLDIPIATAATELTRGQGEVIAGFAQSYDSDSSGAFRILTPAGARNSTATIAATRDIRKLLTRLGVPAKKIVVQSYQAPDYNEAAPIRLSYFAIVAKTTTCGQWPEDLVVNTYENKNYYNFGCAMQSNLAAQIADPNDLLGPRRMTPADATQRGIAIERYREAYTELEDM
ncbi:CpaD family pilus assembly lipoprotein [Rhizobium sp. TRM95111]|uniref:CpaD family pilus assembly protein n=1 Tax=Rhizobium alarense TaxID=2846851 RepID=UPI001F47C982|nr:CpaD family pilus assembly lipoprotein [Rhizobium alarense]MCF3642844.1 CpaD family pilus assembly lipoprotein [Rhizobium alarense]